MTRPFFYHAQIERVVDGDTVDCTIDLGFDIHLFQRVRLLGINAFETRTRDKEEKARGIAAKHWLESVIGDGKVILETQLDERGKYGRVLAYVYRNGNNLGALMVEAGHAVRYPE